MNKMVDFTADDPKGEILRAIVKQAHANVRRHKMDVDGPSLWIRTVRSI